MKKEFNQLLRQVYHFLKKQKFVLLILFVFTIFYFVLRVFDLMSLPIFTDEAIYVRWAQIAKNDATWRFISLTDGKQPSFIWASLIFMKFFSDPLFASRMVSVFAGFGSMIGLFFLGREIFRNKWIGVVTSFLYIIYPMALVYDRMALYDSLVGFFMVWSFYLTVLMVRYLRLDFALLLGLVAGSGALTKSNAFFSIYLLPFAVVLLNLKKEGRLARLIRFVVLSIISGGMTFAMYSILRLSPFFHIIEQKTAIFVFPFGEWIMHPFEFFISNMRGEIDWLLDYMTLPVVGMAFAAFVVDRKFVKEKIVLFLYFLIPFIALGLFGKTIYPRFIFFMTLYLLPLASYTTYKFFTTFKQKITVVVLIVIFLIFQIYTDFRIFTDFGTSPIPRSDRGQYFNSWPAGGGVSEAVTFFEQQATKGPIFISTQGTFGLMPYAFEIYLVNNPNVTIKGFWPVPDEIPDEILEQSQKTPTYVVFYQPCVNCQNDYEPPQSWPVTLVKRYNKGDGDSYMSIYEVIQKP